MRVLLIALVALFVAGSASAAPRGTVKFVRVVQHRGAITATLTYRDRTSAKGLSELEYSNVWLSIRKRGRLVARHKLCNVGALRSVFGCEWDATALSSDPNSIEITRFHGKPLVTVSIWTGCADSICTDSFMALVGRGYVTWVPHNWYGAGYQIERIRGGRQFLVSADGRFHCEFVPCAASALPIRIWTLDDDFGLLDVTSTFRARVRADAHALWSDYLADHRGEGDSTHGVGSLAAWCADEYLLGKARQCQRELRRSRFLARAGRIAAFNKELQKLGYEPKPLRVTKRHGAITATVNYGLLHGTVSSTWLSVSRAGVPVLRHRICPDSSWPREHCSWFGLAWQYIESHDPVAFPRLSPNGPLAVVQHMNDSGGHCCEYAYVVVLGPHPYWVQHNFRWGYKGRRWHGRYYFASGDQSFGCALSSCADSWLPAQIWAIRDGEFVNVTRRTPALVEADAERAWRWYLKARRDHIERGVGILGGWCADEYTLGRGARCQRTLENAYRRGFLNGDGYRGRAFIRTLNRHLEAWGYKQ